VFVGFSEVHSSLVPMVFNLKTLKITPQFHVVFDDWFTTVDSDLKFSDLDDKLVNLFGDSRYQFVFDDEDNICLDKCWDENVSETTYVLPRGISTNLGPTFSHQTSWMVSQKIILFPRETKKFLWIKLMWLMEKNDINANVAGVDIVETTNSVGISNDTDIVESEIPISDDIDSPVSPTKTISPVKSNDTGDVSVPTCSSRPVQNRCNPIRYGYDGSQGYEYTLEAVESLKEKTKSVVAHCSTLLSTVPSYMYQAVYYLSCQGNFTDGSIDCTDPSIYAIVYNKEIGADTTSIIKRCYCRLGINFKRLQ
jgi:hypothetical protein